jgi:Spx/MgsR family transcriptional regulator
MAKPSIRFIQKPTCTSCRRARAFLESRGCTLELRDLGKERFTAAELDRLISTRDYRAFLNTRNELYRKRKMGKKPPSRGEALRLMAREPNLIRRPIVIRGERIVLGFDEAALAELSE